MKSIKTWVSMSMALLLSACNSSSSLDLANAATKCLNDAAPPDYKAGYRCYGDVAGNDRPPVLLIAGTSSNPEANFAWNWFRALDTQGRSYCTITLGDPTTNDHNGMGDIQTSAEYVRYAINETYKNAGNRRIQIVGWSQGGMISRWAFKYFPETRGKVEDLIGLAPSNHGTLTSQLTCTPSCAPAFWQQRADSKFIAALNNGEETYPEIDYTVAYTYLDEIVTPNLPPNPSSALAGGENVSNIALQEICPTNIAEHLAIGTYDPVGYAIALDALDNPGPADRSRVAAQVPGLCLQLTQPNVDQSTYLTDYGATNQNTLDQIANYPKVPEEPALKCYAVGDAP